VAPGSIISIYGTNFVPGATHNGVTAPPPPLPKSLNGAHVLINGIAAPLFYVDSFQINAQVPWEVNGALSLDVQVVSNGVSNVASVVLTSTAPGVFVAAHASNGTQVTAVNPAVVGEYLTVYCTGLGAVQNQPASGAQAPFSPLATTIAGTAVGIGGIATPALFSGLTPGLVGLYQVNVQVPQQVPVGDAIPLVLSSGQAFSNTVTVAIRGSTSSTANVAITSLSTTSVQPFGPMTINGSSFDPDYQIQVTFSDSHGYSFTVPALIATTMTVAVSVPPYFDGSGNIASGTSSVTVSQTSPAGTTSTSNTIGGFQILALPAPPSLPSGSLTLAFLQASQQVQSDLTTAIAGTSLNTAELQSSLSSQTAALAGLIPQLQAVVAGSASSLTMGQFNGVSYSAGSSDLALADQSLLALLGALAGPDPDLSALAAPAQARTIRQRQDQSSASNPIRVAAQQALTAATSPLTTLAQLTLSLTNLLESALTANVQQTQNALYFISFSAAGAALVLAIPPFAGGVLALAEADGWGGILDIALNSLYADLSLFSARALIVATSPLVSACANGLKAQGVYQNYVKSVLATATGTGALYGLLKLTYNIAKIAGNGYQCVSQLPSSPTAGPFFAVTNGYLLNVGGAQLDQVYYLNPSTDCGSAAQHYGGGPGGSYIDGPTLTLPVTLPVSLSSMDSRTTTIDSSTIEAYLRESAVACTVSSPLAFTTTGSATGNVILAAGSNSISASGTGTASTSTSAPESGEYPWSVGSAVGATVYFTLFQNVQYSLTANYTLDNNNPEEEKFAYNLILCGAECPISTAGMLNAGPPGGPPIPNVSLNGVLGPGTYIFQATTQALIAPGPGSYKTQSNFNATFTMTPF